jgi:2-octaprenyl-6-methoxyphenol hydroxylase
VESCAYEIFREEGPLALLPLDKNLYQIIWTSSTSKSIDRLNTDKNFLMDNLSTILPDYFKLDQIVGEVNLFPVSLSINLSIFNSKKLLFVGDSFHTFHPVGGQGLNTCWRDVNNIFDILNENSFISNHNLKYLKSKYYLSRFKDIFFTIVITDSLITFFANRNYLLIPIRKISFILLNKFVFIRKIVLNQMTKSIIFKLIK